MMRLHTVAGDGVLTRRGDLVLFCRPGADAADVVDPEIVEDLLEAHHQVADEDGDGRALADAVGMVATGADVSLVAFAVTGDSLMVTVFGRGWAVVATEYGEQRLAPRRTPPEGLRSTVPGRVLSIRAGIGDIEPDAPVQRWTDLEAGTTRAGGLALLVADDLPDDLVPSVDARRLPAGRAVVPDAPAQEPAPEDVEPHGGTGPPSLPSVPSPAVAVDRTEPFSSVVFVGAEAPRPDERAPLPIAVRPPEPDVPDAPLPAHPPEDDNAIVVGVYCKNGHFDDPSARYCAVCGISMAQQTLVPRPGPRPPLGVLVLDDGSIFSLDTDYVVGRDPSRDPDVEAGTARPLRIDDPEGLLSRVHARIHLDGWEVQVVDLGSANGTGVWGPHDSAWLRAPSRAPLAVRPGTQIGVGRRQMRYESHRNT